MKTNILKMLSASICGLIMTSGAIAQTFPENGTEAEELAIGGPSSDYLTLEFPRGTDQECAPFKGQKRSIGGDIAKYGKAVLMIIFPKDCPSCIAAADQADAVISKYSDKLTVWYANQRMNGDGFCDDIIELGNTYPYVKKADFKFLDIYMFVDIAKGITWHYGAQDSYWIRPGSPSVYRIFDPKSKKVTGISYGVGAIESQIQTAIKNNFSPLATAVATENLASYSIFPNPATESLNLNLALNNAAPALVSIKNTLGIEVLRQDIGTAVSFNHNIDIQNLDKAIYMISVVSNGVTIASDRFVKQ